MAFIDIQDPTKREQIVQDYIKNIKEIRQRKENQKVRGIAQRRDIEKVFQPVVQATEKSASQITSEIKNLQEQPKEQPKNEKPISEALDYFLNQYDKAKLDQYFGIYEKNGIYMMGDKEIKVDEHDNIHVNEASFKGTKGLWRLIMMKKPKVYEPEDLREYQELIMRTNVLDAPHTINSSDRPRNTAKYKFLTTNFTQEESGEDDSEEEKENEEKAWEEKDQKKGTGIVFLPGDINGLIEQLHLLLAEFRAGNKAATRNQILAILDQLLKRNYLTQDEYNGVCRMILC